MENSGSMKYVYNIALKGMANTMWGEHFAHNFITYKLKNKTYLL